MTKRKGASSKSAIDLSVLQQLNAGLIETATLSEALAVDFSALMAQAFPQIGSEALAQLKPAQALGIIKKMEEAARILAVHFGDEAYDVLRSHASDTVRGWAAFVLGLDLSLSLQEKLERVRPLADDAHFGVREWAWLAVRPAIGLDIVNSLELLTPWVADSSANVRRFAVEATRPRGVWCKHIAKLKAAPALGEPLLDGVMQDESRYVQNSCANWLNDAAKSDADWVTCYCEKWRRQNPSDAVTYITRRALRSLA